MALAGHPPLLLMPVDGPVREVGLPGTALGFFPTIDITQVSVALAPGDVLLAYTRWGHRGPYPKR